MQPYGFQAASKHWMCSNNSNTSPRNQYFTIALATPAAVKQRIKAQSQVELVWCSVPWVLWPAGLRAQDVKNPLDSGNMLLHVVTEAQLPSNLCFNVFQKLSLSLWNCSIHGDGTPRTRVDQSDTMQLNRTEMVDCAQHPSTLAALAL
jgi:hypothetical protein